MRRPLVLGLALVVSGCAGLDSSTPGVAPAPGRRGDGHREARAAPRVARDTDPVAAWETVQTRVRRGEAAGVLADAQRLAAAAEAGRAAATGPAPHTAGPARRAPPRPVGHGPPAGGCRDRARPAAI